MTRIHALAPFATALLAGVAVPQETPPTNKEVKELVEAYFELDWKDMEDVAEQRQIVARLDGLAPLTEREANDWRKKLLKQWSKGPKLPRKSGTHYLWEDEERGKFILGGKSKGVKGLFIGMHGGGVGSGEARSSYGAFNSAASSRKWFAIFPEVLEKTELGWTDSGTEEFVMELVERARRTAKIDPDFVFFGGHSMGGYGSWTLGAHHADEVAALTPSAGAPTPILSGNKVVDIVQGIVPNLRNVAMCIFQSSDDPRVPPEPNRVAVERLEQARERWGGFEFEYWEVDGNGHDLPPGGTDALLAKVEEKKREPHPARVVWQPTLPWKRQFYWLFWDEPAPREIVVADLDREGNTISVETKAPRLAGLHVLLSDAVVDMEKEVVVRVNGEERYRGVPERSLSTLVMTSRFGDPARIYDARISLE